LIKALAHDSSNPKRFYRSSKENIRNFHNKTSFLACYLTMIDAIIMGTAIEFIKDKKALSK